MFPNGFKIGGWVKHAEITHTGSVQFFRNLPHWITKLLVIYYVIHKRVYTPPQDLTTWIIEAIDHSSNSTMAFTKNLGLGFCCKCKCHWWVWRMINSLYYSSRKIPERCENSFVNYRINYQKLSYSLRRIWTQPLCTNVSILCDPPCVFILHESVVWLHNRSDCCNL